MDLAGLDEVLHEDFKMILLDGTRLEGEMWHDDNFEREEFLEIHRRIFRGDAELRTGRHGGTLRSTPSFETRSKPWTSGRTFKPGDPNFGGTVGRIAAYYVTLRFLDALLEHEYFVQHDVAVYMAPDTTESGTW